MAKKSTPQSNKSGKKEPTGTTDSTEKWLPWALAGLAFILYSTGFGNQMVGMDDHSATVDNPAVKDFLIFGGFNLGMYAPLTWIGYQISYILGKESPQMYHLLSALVHAINVVLVFKLFRRLDSNVTVSALVALFFAIHPLNVEAVAWIAGFSTPLFSMFSLLAMNYYVRHTKEEEGGFGKNYWHALTMFLLACLAKSAAVTLPLTLLVLDLWKKRGFSPRVLLEKAPFFAISLGFGLLTLYSRQYAGQLDQPADFTIFDRGLMACHTVLFYWKKLLMPTGLSIWYPFEKTNGVWSWDYLAAPVILFGILFAAWRSRQAMPLLWIGILFYLSNIVLSLPWSTFGTFELRSDRYNYLAGLGIFVIIAALPDYLKEKRPSWSGAAWAVILGLAFIWLVTSALRIRDWKDTMTLIDKAIAATGDNHGKAYLWRGMAYGKASDAQKAIKDFSLALQKNDELYEAYKFRGNIFGMMKNYEQSVTDLTKFLEHYPIEVPELYYRGLYYANLERNQEAVADFNRALELDSTFARVYRARGNCYLKLGETEKGNADLAKWESMPK
ncbi:MAG: tetratricopeptide repeat protein [Saprospiraceae bacterium]|nr:tetratricopeptide repeat protein [Saprospiraceae bacterium]